MSEPLFSKEAWESKQSRDTQILKWMIKNKATVHKYPEGFVCSYCPVYLIKEHTEPHTTELKALSAAMEQSK